ncbi:MAG: hypothetical protein CSB44_02860 [Gammaproteobacteria bacterium]|nr:MAG: hypothetical protein CSB44_02860 [Gammaproteobacteria bacterium]
MQHENGKRQTSRRFDNSTSATCLAPAYPDTRSSTNAGKRATTVTGSLAALAATGLAVLSSTAVMAQDAAPRWQPEEFIADPALQNDFTESLPDFGETNGLRYAILQGLAILQGDMVLGAVDADGKLVNRSLIRNNIGKDEQTINENGTRGLGTYLAIQHWPDGVVPFVYGSNLGQSQRDNINGAIEHWMSHTGIKFVERTAENESQYLNYVRFVDSMSCASYVGMQTDKPEQTIMVSEACPLGSVIHEVGHAIGLYHEHTRADRNNYITVLEENIRPSKLLNFEVQTADVAVTYSDYDYGSIMHYGEYFFSVNNEPTIVVPDGIDAQVGQRIALSDMDAESVDRMYATDLALAPPSGTPTDDGLEITVTVENRGSFGANTLKLSLILPEGNSWRAISENAGWDCRTSAETLNCERDSFVEHQISQFLVLADAPESALDELDMTITSRTMDLDDSNNRSVGGVLQSPPTPTNGEVSGTEPLVGAANVSDGSDENATGQERSEGNDDNSETVTSSVAGGGSGGGAFFALLGALALVLGVRRGNARMV